MKTSYIILRFKNAGNFKTFINRKLSKKTNKL